MVYEIFFRKLFSKNADLTSPLLLYLSHNTVKYFLEHFSKWNQTRKNNHFFWKYFIMKNILQRHQTINETTRKSPDQVGYWALRASAWANCICHCVLHEKIDETKSRLVVGTAVQTKSLLQILLPRFHQPAKPKRQVTNVVSASFILWSGSTSTWQQQERGLCFLQSAPSPTR